MSQPFFSIKSLISSGAIIQPIRRTEMNYHNMTNPEIVAAVSGLEGTDKDKALASLPDAQREAVEEALAASIPADGARAAVLERLGREKQINDAQAWTADGISPNSALVTEAAAGKFTEAKAPEAVIDDLTAQTQAKIEESGDLLAAAGKDTGATLSAETADASTSKTLKGKLPEDFPGRAALEAGGVTTYAQVRKLRDGDGLTSVAGVGDATASQIEEAIKE
jgi:hypothetical protein